MKKKVGKNTTFCSLSDMAISDMAIFWLLVCSIEYPTMELFILAPLLSGAKPRLVAAKLVANQDLGLILMSSTVIILPNSIWRLYVA